MIPKSPPKKKHKIDFLLHILKQCAQTKKDSLHKSFEKSKIQVTSFLNLPHPCENKQVSTFSRFGSIGQSTGLQSGFHGQNFCLVGRGGFEVQCVQKLCLHLSLYHLHDLFIYYFFFKETILQCIYDQFCEVT